MTRTAAIGCVVEGHGDALAVPELLRRFGLALQPEVWVNVPPPVRVHRDRLLKSGEIERAAQLAADKAGEGSGLLVLVDADDDCPVEIAQELRMRASSVLADRSVGVVLAKFEFENWFIAAAESLRGRRGLADGLLTPEDPERIRDAKGWLGDRMDGSRRYSPVLDQPALTATFSMIEAQRSRSFRKCVAEVERLLGEVAH